MSELSFRVFETSEFRFVRGAACALAMLQLTAGVLNGQEQQPVAGQWLAHADLAPPFSVPASKSDWQRQRERIRAELWELMGTLPPRPRKPEVRVLSRQNKEGFTLEKFEFDNGAGSIVPGYLLLPTNVLSRSPAVLYCHWHGGEYEVGKEELFQSKHTPEAPGPALARRGYVVLAIDSYCFGERNGAGPGGSKEKGSQGEQTATKFNLWVGRTLWGMILRDDLMALDYLESRPEVDPNRIGVMGMSMGATRAWWLMALEDRLKTGVAICCLTRYQNLIGQGLLQAHSIYYYVPNVLRHFDTEAIVALIAPRPVLFLDGDRDSTSPVEGIRAIESAVGPVYRLYGEEGRFQSVIYPNQGHLYTPTMWARSLEWLDQNLVRGEK
ncbi:MAG TPA: alpha/beta hydrolase family protein [Verrucomicrobiae bacterium]|nr:alpha/beta hydrolase family protein [Verrucomicrobiae bacterium]